MEAIAATAYCVRGSFQMTDFYSLKMSFFSNLAVSAIAINTNARVMPIAFQTIQCFRQLTIDQGIANQIKKGHGRVQVGK